ncbi:MAG: GNAT family N-acetyltransferase [Flavobacteriales bacterium]|nr:GNAT family N-acetyltransferase [Flavobacteriales bacterium]
MLDFKPFTIADKDIFEKYTHFSGKMNCDLSFTNCYIWNPHARWCIVEGFMVVRFNIDAGEKIGYCEPLGDGDIEKVLALMLKDAHEYSQPLRLFNMSEEFAKKIKESSFSKVLHIYTDRSMYDYVYSAERLRTLPGKELQPKRNHINQFTRLYNYRVEELTKVHYTQVVELLDRWVQEKERTERYQAYFLELENIRRSFEYFDQLALRGIALYVDDKMVAFTYGSAINNTTFDIHIEKADTAYTGVFSMINQQFLQRLPLSYTYVNREEDMGIPGLRKSKMSYHPDVLYPKWYAFEKNTKEWQVWSLWQDVFHDDDAFVSRYLNNYSTKENTFLAEKDGQVVSMVHTPVFYNKYGQVGYVYGVATAVNERKKGLASELLKKALKKMYTRGDVMCALIPSEESVMHWYKKSFSFSEYWQKDKMRFHMDIPFDFGSGVEDKDMGVFRIVNIEKYIRQYALEHLDDTFEVNVVDEVIPENTGCYAVKNGSVFVVKKVGDTQKMDIGDFFEKYSLVDTDFYDEQM